MKTDTKVMIFSFIILFGTLAIVLGFFTGDWISVLKAYLGTLILIGFMVGIILIGHWIFDKDK